MKQLVWLFITVLLITFGGCALSQYRSSKSYDESLFFTVTDWEFDIVKQAAIKAETSEKGCLSCLF
ncbi:MAG: hypothetical protein HY300_06700 [Verrucomicrobia bacterium]|nr:hypothetical protein [Verrucomicrobiota bacterium]